MADNEHLQSASVGGAPESRAAREQNCPSQGPEATSGAGGAGLALPGRGALDSLFVALFLTSFGALVFGNLLLLKSHVLLATLVMWVPFFGLLLIFYVAARLTGGLAAGIVNSLVLAYLLVRLPSPAGLVIFYLLAAGAVVYALRNLRPSGVHWVLIVLMSGVGVAVCFSVALAYNTFDNLNALRAGVVHKDPLFHAAMAAMIKNYGVLSTGLHGLVETPYYVMSHYLVALASSASGRGVFEVYGIYTIVFLIPLLIFSLAACAAGLFRGRPLSLPVAWGVVCLFLVLPQRYLGAWGVNPQTMISESSVLGMALFALVLPYVFAKSLRTADVVVVAVLTAVLAFTKLPTALILAGLFAARWLFIGRLSGKSDLLAALLTCGIATFFLLANEAGASENSRLGFFHYIGTFAWRGWAVNALAESLASGSGAGRGVILNALLSLSAFWLLHFLFSWIALAGVVARKGFRALWSDPVAVALWASVVGGSVFLALFVDEHAAAYYFSHPAFFVAIPVLAGAIGSWSFLSGRFWAAALMVMLAGAVICHHSRAALVKNSNRSAVGREEHQSRLIDALLDLRVRMPVNIAMKAPPRVWEYEPVRFPGEIWESVRLNGPPWYSASPFVYPAISERPWVGVIPPASLPDPANMRFGADRYTSHGYARYQIEPSSGQAAGPPVLPAGMQIVDAKLEESLGAGKTLPQQEFAPRSAR